METQSTCVGDEIIKGWVVWYFGGAMFSQVKGAGVLVWQLYMGVGGLIN